MLMDTPDDTLAHDAARGIRDAFAALLAHHELIGLMHISDTGTDVWGHDPIGTGVINWEGLGRAVESTLGFDNVVLEIIREQNTLEEFAQAMRDLPAFGWNVGTREEIVR